MSTATIYKFPERREQFAPPVRHSRHRLEENEESRRAMLGKVHLALQGFYKDIPGYTEDVYRYSLEEWFGVRSSAQLSCGQLHELLLRFSEIGFRAVRKRGVRRGVNHKAQAPATLTKDKSGLGREGWLRMIEGLLTSKGKHEGTEVPWGYAVGILKKQTGGVITSLDHAGPEELRAVMAALKRDATRKGYWRG